MATRAASFAGSWYPSSGPACETQIHEFLSDGTAVPADGSRLSGGIVPHAGWYFSGAIACRVIHALRQTQGNSVDLVVLFGMHLHPDSPAYIMAEGAWETPFGELPIDTDMTADLIRRFSFRIETPARFTPDNTIELQLPFVKYFFPDAAIVPIGVPPRPESLSIGTYVARRAAEEGRRAVVIGSTDLTHYGVNYGFMPKGSGPKAVDWVKNENDRSIIEAMLAMDPQRVIDEALSHQNACCAGAAAAAIAAAKEMGATTAHCLQYATSYDKSPGDSLVGYAGITLQ